MRLFAHRLAVQIGCADVSGLLDQLPQSAWLDWIAYFEREPWGEDRADARAAIVAAVTYNMNRGRGSPAKNVADFMAHRPHRSVTTPHHVAALKGALKGLSNADANKSNG